MAVWKDKELEMVAACERLGLPIEVNYAPFQANVPQMEMVGGKPAKLTLHETGNKSLGAGARSHRNFVAYNPGPPLNPERVSFTMSVDDKRLVVICRLNYRNNHAGDAAGVGNKTSGSMEICVNRDGDWLKTKDNAAKAAAAYQFVWGLSTLPTELVQHHHWYGKNCPQTIRAEGSWQSMVAAIARYIEQLKGAGGGGGGGGQPEPIPTPVTERVFLTGFKVGGGFLKKWDEYGLEVMGYPISEEYPDGEYTRQRFENVQLRWRAGEPVRFDAIGRQLSDIEEGRV